MQTLVNMELKKHVRLLNPNVLAHLTVSETRTLQILCVIKVQNLQALNKEASLGEKNVAYL